MTPLERILACLPHATHHGHSWRARCPAHQGESRDSLSLAEGEDGRALLYCFGRCAPADIVAALGLELRDLFEGGASRNGHRPHGPSKSAQEEEAERILLAVASTYVVDLLEEPEPALPPDETMAPYTGILEDLWDHYAADANQEWVLERWAEMRPALEVGAPKLLAAVDRRLARRRGEPLPDDHASEVGDGQSAVEDKTTPPRKSQATLLVELAADVELWHTPDGEAYATIPIDGHRETWPLKVKAFRRWLARRYYEHHETTPGSQAIQDALGVMEGTALFDGTQHDVYTRLGEHEGKIYLDLANERWEAIEIDAQGWRLVSEPPVKFRRSRGMLSLPCPECGGTLDDLRKLLNVEDESAWVLVKAWLVQTCRPIGPYPVLVLHGEQGSAKTTVSRFLRALIDPNKAALRSEPRDERDLMIAATNGWLIGLDNLSHLSPWLSDAICRLATGGGFATRELYENAEEVIFSAQRPILLNGIEELATRGDLLDRCIILYLPAIPEERRKPEATLWREFEDKRPKILGALLDAVSEALHMIGTVKLDCLPRMADFALWAVAAAPKLTYTDQTFLSAYGGTREAAHELALEASPIVPPLRDLLASTSRTWQGTATALLRALEEPTTEATRKTQSWPKDGRSLSGALRRIAPDLRAIGIDVTPPAGRHYGRIWRLERVGIPPSPPSPPSPDEGNQGDTGDAKGDANPRGDARPSSPSAEGDARGTQGGRKGDAESFIVTHRKQREGDAGDGRDANNPTHSNPEGRCAVCGHVNWRTIPGGDAVCRSCERARP